MQPRVVLALCASVVALSSSVVSAATCTDAQKAAANVLGEDPAFETACADVFAQDDGASDAFDPSLFSNEMNTSMLAYLEPCKQTTCSAYLQEQVSKVPDCELENVNVRIVFKSIADYCASNETDDGSSSDFVFANVTDDSSASETTDPTVTVPSTSQEDTKNEGEEVEEATYANTKSAASAAAFASATAIVAASLLSAVYM